LLRNGTGRPLHADERSSSEPLGCTHAMSVIQSAPSARRRPALYWSERVSAADRAPNATAPECV
jgi:hypothetical protein